MIKTATTALAAAALTALAGCYSIGGVPASRDRFTYESHPLMPATVTIMDTRTGESVWSLDVPVGQKLVVRFYDDRTPDDATPTRTAMMRWRVVDLDDGAGSLNNEFAVPIATARKINFELREGPEYATDSRVTARPSPTTTTVSPAEQRAASTPATDPAAPTSPSPSTGAPELDPVPVDD
ncbi:MAG: hypothetical protein AAFR96_04800 [Planctomycetota bacterium]